MSGLGVRNAGGGLAEYNRASFASTLCRGADPPPPPAVVDVGVGGSTGLGVGNVVAGE